MDAMVGVKIGAFHEGELFARSEARNRILTSRDGRAFEELGELISERGAITGLRVASWEEKLAEEGEVEGESGGDRRGMSESLASPSRTAPFRHGSDSSACASKEFACK